MKKIILTTIVMAVLLPMAVWAQCADCPTGHNKSDDKGKLTTAKAEDNSKNPAGNPKITAVNLPGFNKTVNLPDGKHFTYNFSKKPKIGTAILQVHLYDKKNRHSDDYTVYVTSDMPSMRGAHASGDVKMKANAKGVLMAPINFVMPGMWEINLKFYKDGKHTNTYTFMQKI